MRSTFAGPPALPWPAAAPGDLQRVQLARRRFFASGEPPRGEVQTAVWQSWQRCVQAGLQPEHCSEFQPVGRGKVRYLVDRDHLLLKAAQAPLDELQTVLAHSGCKLLLTDREGLVLRVTPALDSDGAVLRSAGRVGVDLGELMVGTTAPGMVARDGCPCALTAGEHFYEVLGGMRCVAAPIRNNQGTVVAVLDLSVEDRPFGFDALWLVRSYAGAIENRLRIAQTRQQVLLRLHSSPGALAGPAVGLAAVDAHGRIAWLNGLAAALTGCPTQGTAAAALRRTAGLRPRSGAGLHRRTRPATAAAAQWADGVAAGRVPPAG